ncbi:MAG: DNA polymerase III subunit beta [Alphaproteobacteria bacterium]|nr:DNA polymerase III subunit beta [Alphaproteobacteria bacterium]MBT5799926.1 DNA polymerase III subunit beta [Alphaproteobacteria bacterium]
MKIAIDRMNLLRPLGHINSVVERRNTVPILSNVVLRAASGKLSFTATDMDMDIVTTTPCSISSEGATTIPAHLLFEIVKKLPDGAEVQIQVADGHAQISAGRSSFKLPTLPVEDFPAINSSDLPVRFSLTTPDLRNLIDTTKFAISTEETRYYLNGIYLHFADTTNLTAVATDGHRLALSQMKAPAGSEIMPPVIVPRKAVTELRKLLDDEPQEIDIRLSETRAEFIVGDVRLTTKLIDGSFPDYKRVIPAGNDKIASIDVSLLSAAADRVSTIASDKSRAIKLNISSGQLVLSASNPDASSATEMVEIDYDGDAIDIGFNAKYLMDILTQIQGQTIAIELADSGSPSLLRDPEDDANIFVLMPMRV